MSPCWLPWRRRARYYGAAALEIKKCSPHTCKEHFGPTAEDRAHSHGMATRGRGGGARTQTIRGPRQRQTEPVAGALGFALHAARALLPTAVFVLHQVVCSDDR